MASPESIPSIGIVTAADPLALDHFEEASRSVDVLRAAAPSRVEWVLCVDGPTPIAIEGPDKIVRGSALGGGGGGVAMARNTALAELDTECVLSLDADDELVADGVLKMAAVMRDPSYGWVAANQVFDDGTRTPHWFDAGCEWPANSLAESWTAPFPFHPGCVMTRRLQALAAGGWPAVRTNEDLGFVLALNHQSRGRSIAAVMMKYRSWPRQVTRHPEYPASKTQAFAFIEAVENARRVLALQRTITAPTLPQS